MAECIHGFDEGLCDICFPRTSPEPPPTVAATATRTAPRTATTKRVAPPRKRPAGAPAGVPAPGAPAFSARRLYHWTHSRNLEAILLDGAIRAIASGADPDVDIAAPVVRELRARADVGDGRTVDSFVPFALSTDAARWSEIREGASGAQWSTAARLTSPTEYVMLVVPSSALGPDVVVADGDASAPATRFSIGDPARAVARAAREDPELGDVELLVPGTVPIQSLVLIGVPNEPMRNRVRRMFDAIESSPPRIVVHPPWFLPAEA